MPDSPTGLADPEFGVLVRDCHGAPRRPGRRLGRRRQRLPGRRREAAARCSIRSPPSRGSAASPERRERGRRARPGSSRREPPTARTRPSSEASSAETFDVSGPPRRRDQRGRDRPVDRRDARGQRPAQLDRARQLRRRTRRPRRLDHPPLPGRRHPGAAPAADGARRNHARPRRRLPRRARGHGRRIRAPTRRYGVALDFLGAGVWIADAAGRRVDSVGIYAMNEMDSDNVTASPCTKGVALTTYAPDRMLEETFQRTRFTGIDADDFVAAPATPGVLDLARLERPDASGSPASSTRRRHPSAHAPRHRPAAIRRRSTADGARSVVGLERRRTAQRRERGPAERRARPVASPGRPPTTATTSRTCASCSTRRDLAAGSSIELDRHAPSRATSCSSRPGTGSRWTPLATGVGDPVDGSVTLARRPRRRSAARRPRDPARAGRAAHRADPVVRARRRARRPRRLRPRDLAHHRHPVPHRDLPRGLRAARELDRRQRRRPQDRVRDPHRRRHPELGRPGPERRAGAAGVRAGVGDPGDPRRRRACRTRVLPGNHDNKRGIDNSLFNEYFPPSRYEGNGAYAGSIAPGDNSANFSIFESAGARFLMLSLPFAYGERELAWAEEVVTSHPDANVIVSTHEHLTPKTNEVEAARAGNVALDLPRQRALGSGDRPEPQRRARARRPLPRPRRDRHRERRRHRGAHRRRAARRLPGVPHPHRRAGDRIPAAAAARPRLRHGRRRHLLGAARRDGELRVRLPAVRARQRPADDAVERPAVAHRRDRAAGSLRRRGRRVHHLRELPVREVGHHRHPSPSRPRNRSCRRTATRTPGRRPLV